MRAMVRDLSVPLSIEPVDIRRESDGLAMSSRNAYLTPAQRQQALALSQALKAGIAAAENGGDGAAVRQAALTYLANADGVEVDYVAVVGADCLRGPSRRWPGPTTAKIPACSWRAGPTSASR